MCDCYTDYCAGCKRPIPMHLGDFLTERYEVQVFCEDCWERVKEFYKRKKYTVWRLEDPPEEIKQKYRQSYEAEKEWIGKRIVVVSLTGNAWKNRDLNYPNVLLTCKKER